MKGRRARGWLASGRKHKFENFDPSGFRANDTFSFISAPCRAKPNLRENIHGRVHGNARAKPMDRAGSSVRYPL